MGNHSDLFESIQNINNKLDRIQKQIMAREKPFLSIDEASDYLNIPKATIYGYISKGVIPYHKLNGRRVYFDIKELDAYVLNAGNRKMSNAEIESEAAHLSESL